MMRASDGDGFWEKHGRMKNDFFGVFFAPTPTFHPFDPHAPRNAAVAMRDLELAAQAAGMTAETRADTPLYGPVMGEEFSHWEVEVMFEIMMRFGANVSELEFKDYTIHSFRVFVACALMSKDVPRHTIKRLLRWRGDLSLEIYARLNDNEWALHAQQVLTAHVDSTIAARLAALGSLDLELAARRLAAG